jgi:dTDP-4-dehydrorhamnose reductase
MSRPSPGKVLICGAGGLLGRALRRGAPPAWEVVGLTRADCDITDPAAVAAALERWRPAAVINAAAYTDVDRAESEPLAALAANTVGPAVLAAACGQRGLALLHVSTDHVFDGRRQTPYEVDDEPRPLSVYGASKLGGEQWVRRLAPNAYVVRTSGLFGAGGRNFVDAVAARARAGGPLKVVADQTCARTWSADLAAGLWQLLEQRPQPGVYHAANAGAVTWHALACTLVELLGLAVEVQAVTSAEWGAAAPRPAYSVLSGACWAAAGLTPLRPEREALAEYLASSAAADGAARV